MSFPGEERDEPAEGEGGDGTDTPNRTGTDSSRQDGPAGRREKESHRAEELDSPPRNEEGEKAPTREEWTSTDEHSGPPKRHGEDSETPGWQIFVYDVVSSVLAVMLVGAYLYAVSGVWPPLVAVESRSMVPNMQVNDLVFVMEADRFAGPGAQGETGVVTARVGQRVDYRTFGGYGDVIVYERNGDDRRVPIIHRAMLWVEEDENWYDEANKAYISATECGDSPREGLRNCPAPHAGFITKGDNNGRYDQVSGLSGPVKPEWVVGTAEIRLPGLGWIRLQSQAAAVNESRQIP